MTQGSGILAGSRLRYCLFWCVVLVPILHSLGHCDNIVFLCYSSAQTLFLGILCQDICTHTEVFFSFSSSPFTPTSVTLEIICCLGYGKQFFRQYQKLILEPHGCWVSILSSSYMPSPLRNSITNVFYFQNILFYLLFLIQIVAF